jgi:hypothetical protein
MAQILQHPATHASLEVINHLMHCAVDGMRLAGRQCRPTNSAAPEQCVEQEREASDRPSDKV